MENKVFLGSIITSIAVLAVAFAIFVKDSPTLQVRTVDGEPVTVVNGDKFGAIPGDEVYNEIALLGGLRYTEKTAAIAKTSIYSTSTLTYKDSGTSFLVSASGTRIILPAVASKGTVLRFIISGAMDTASTTIASAEGDNISGTITVNAADVACSGEDYIVINQDLETVGDFLELRSDGTTWLIGDSVFDTAGALECTDPS